MTQYLVTTFKDSTGRKHTHITVESLNVVTKYCVIPHSSLELV
ncbi:DUF1381 domain-containing protein [Staphylococcus aureus]